MGRKATSLTPEERLAFDRVYEDRVLNAAGARGDIRAELTAARHLLEAVMAGLAPTGDGGVGSVSRPAVDWADPDLVMAALDEAERESRTRSRGAVRTGGRNETRQGLLIIAAALAAFGWWGYQAWFAGGETTAEVERSSRPRRPWMSAARPPRRRPWKRRCWRILWIRPESERSW